MFASTNALILATSVGSMLSSREPHQLSLVKDRYIEHATPFGDQAKAIGKAVRSFRSAGVADRTGCVGGNTGCFIHVHHRGHERAAAGDNHYLPAP